MRGTHEKIYSLRPLSAIISITISKLLFFPTLVFRIFLLISRSNLFTIWLRLELNIVSVLPLLRRGFNILGAEVGMKYFLVQAVASSVFLFGVLGSQVERGMVLLRILALCIKLGAAPFHFWFIRILRYCDRELLFLLSTVQKIIPLIIIQTLGVRRGLEIVVIVRALVRGLGIFNHSGFSYLFAYSSVFSVGWRIAGRLVTMWLWVAYLIIYALGLGSILLIIQSQGYFTVRSIYSAGLTATSIIVIFFGFLVIGGLPPFGRFWVKLIMVRMLQAHGYILLVIVLLLGTVWILYAYIRTVFILVSRGGGRSFRVRFLGQGWEAIILGIIVSLPLFIRFSLVLSRGVTRKILIFKILEKSKLDTLVYKH